MALLTWFFLWAFDRKSVEPSFAVMIAWIAAFASAGPWPSWAESAIWSAREALNKLLTPGWNGPETTKEASETIKKLDRLLESLR